MSDFDLRRDPRLSHLASSLVEILRFRAAHQTDRPAYIFDLDGRGGEVSVTYGELDHAARRVASELRARTSPGDRALLLYPTGRDFLAAFMGCLYAGVVCIPLFPPRASRRTGRLRLVINDSEARLALTPASGLDEVRRHLKEEGVEALEVLAAGIEPKSVGGSWADSPPAPSDVAYLQYTSGSTSQPKGVMVTHRNLIYNCSYMAGVYGLSSESTAVTWLPHFHDFGLVDGLLNPLFIGCPVVVLSPAQFARRPIVWLEAITRHRATHSGSPNFGFDLCLRKVRPEQRAELKLDSWETAPNGGEPVRSRTLNAFSEYFAPSGFNRRTFLPAFGLAEATLMVTGGRKEDPPTVLHVDGPELERGRVVALPAHSEKSRPLVGCGFAHRDMEVAIVDPQSHRICAEGSVGEIWVGGPTLPAGYWGRPEATALTFRASTEDGRGPFMRTGDLGFLQGDELFVAGRLKDMIIIRGGNYYPHDVEWVAEEAHASLQRGRAAAFAVDSEQGERLVVAIEMARSHRHATHQHLEEIASAIRAAVAEEFEIDVYSVVLLRPATMPMTSSGKIQRHACRNLFLQSELDVVHESRPAVGGPSDESPPVTDAGPSTLPNPAELAQLHRRERRRVVVDYLREQVAAVMELPVSEVRAGHPLGNLGIDSLRGKELTSNLEQSLGLLLPTALIWNHPTILQIGDYILDRMQMADGSPEKVVQRVRAHGG